MNILCPVKSFVRGNSEFAEPIVNPGVSCQRQQRGKMTATQPKWRQLCVEYGGLLEIVFFAIKVTFVGYQFLTDFYSHNRCVCSTRSHGPLLCAFCLCFYFNIYRNTCFAFLGYSSLIILKSTVVFQMETREAVISEVSASINAHSGDTTGHLINRWTSVSRSAPQSTQ